MSQTIAIIGGGIIGCSAAWFLRERGFAGEIVVVERDPSYQQASTTLSAASIRVQFGSPVNVALSQFGATFLRGLPDLLGRDVDVGFVERGYLILSPPNAGGEADRLLALQRAHGCMVERFDPAGLAARFPWLATQGVGAGTFGVRDEGWFDAASLLAALRGAAIDRGVRFRHAHAAGLREAGGRIAAVRLDDGSEIATDWAICAAGAHSGRLMASIGIDLPVAPRKRCVYHFKGPLDGKDIPMLFDVSGVWIRPEGAGFIGGIAPDPADDPDAHDDFQSDMALFEDRFWPALAARIPALEQLRVLNAWAGHYDMNLFDHNAVIGAHPDIDNLVFACGFSGHGVMHAPGAGRAVAERIVHGGYQTIDVSPLAFERIAQGRPYVESTIY